MILERGELRSEPFLDISDHIAGAGLGLWSIALHPDVGTVEVAVHRLGGAAGTVSVEVTARAETATDQADSRAPAAVLTWGDGDADAKTFPLEILDDSDDEPDET